MRALIPYCITTLLCTTSAQAETLHVTGTTTITIEGSATITINQQPSYSYSASMTPENEYEIWEREQALRKPAKSTPPPQGDFVVESVFQLLNFGE